MVRPVVYEQVIFLAVQAENAFCDAVSASADDCAQIAVVFKITGQVVVAQSHVDALIFQALHGGAEGQKDGFEVAVPDGVSIHVLAVCFSEKFFGYIHDYLAVVYKIILARFSPFRKQKRKSA